LSTTGATRRMEAKFLTFSVSLTQVTSATIVYTAPARPTTSNAVTATGSTTTFSATQTLGPGLGTVLVMTFTLTATPPTTVTAGTSANWTLTASAGISGAYALTVTGSNANSPNHTVAPAFPISATFAGGTATAPITMVDAAAQGTGFQFTLTGPAVASAVLAVVTPVAGAVSTASIASLVSGTCGSATFSVSTAFAEPAAPTLSGTEVVSSAAATASACTFTANSAHLMPLATRRRGVGR
jgi:hypothetical protein